MLLRAFGIGIMGLLWSTPALAQLIDSDNTVGTTVTPLGNQWVITSGSQQSTTLFHSFDTFSPDSANVLFQLNNNQSAVDLVVGRVTGVAASLVNAQLQLTGGNNPDLLLLNPNGITFGPNATLLLPGSFLASTGESVLFDGGLNFSATQPGNAPPLTISTPIGIQMGSNPSPIQINGTTGHEIAGGFPNPPRGTGGESKLQLPPGHSLLLLGGAIQTNSGVLQAPSGRVELGAVGTQNANSTIGLSIQGANWTADYDNIEQLAPIVLSGKSLVDISGSAAPQGISLTGNDVELTGGTILLANNFGEQAAGDITLNAAGRLALNQLAELDRNETRILSYAFGSGAGSNINLSGENIRLEDGSYVFANTLTTGQGGSLRVQADESVTLIGTSDLGTNGFPSTTLAADTFGEGSGGNVTVNSQELQLIDGGIIFSLTAGPGAGGNITANVANDILIVSKGSTPTNPIALESSIRASSFGAGEAGQISIDAQNLRLRDGGLVEASNQGAGASGSIWINASESIDIQGGPILASSGNPIFSAIRASTQKPVPFVQNLFGLAPVPSGRSGTVVLSSPIIQLNDGGRIEATNEGVGNGGDISILGGKLILANQSEVSAITDAGSGGSIAVRLDELLAIGNQSLIDAESLSNGDGGNVRIEAPLLLAFKDSDIVANAVTGNGGNVEITAQEIIGLEFREQRTSGSDITASSEFGLDGTVTIRSFTPDNAHSVVDLPSDLSGSDIEIAASCQDQEEDNELILSGRGGLPLSPANSLNPIALWNDARQVSARVSDLSQPSRTGNASNEVKAWRINRRGQVELVASGGDRRPSLFISCHDIRS